MSIDILSDYAPEPEMARALKVKPRTLYRYRNQPDGLPYAEIGGRIYYHIPTTRKWLEEQRTRHPNPTRTGRAAR